MLTFETCFLHTRGLPELHVPHKGTQTNVLINPGIRIIVTPSIREYCSSLKTEVALEVIYNNLKHITLLVVPYIIRESDSHTKNYNYIDKNKRNGSA